MTYPCANRRLARPSLRRMAAIAVMACLVCMAPSLPSFASDAQRGRHSVPVVTLDWTLAETLLALDVTPLGVAQTMAYRDWVGEPTLPENVVDIGLRAQPNLELLAQLAPKHILISPMFAALAPRLSRIAPVSTIGLYLAEGDIWTQALAATRAVARLVDRQAAAETLIAEVESHIGQAAAQLPAGIPPLLIVQFMDARHVRVFGDHSLYQAVLQRLGLSNAWQGTTNAWGFALVGLEQLADIRPAQMVVVDPLPVGIEGRLAENGLWQNLPSVRQRNVIHLKPVWSFGGLPSARRFADQISAAFDSRLDSQPDDASS
ncbi:ABC transporter substrate-binding protein [Halomonas sp. WWR20]